MPYLMRRRREEEQERAIGVNRRSAGSAGHVDGNAGHWLATEIPDGIRYLMRSRSEEEQE
jgi:hypothetical protein